MAQAPLGGPSCPSWLVLETFAAVVSGISVAVRLRQWEAARHRRALRAQGWGKARVLQTGGWLEDLCLDMRQRTLQVLQGAADRFDVAVELPAARLGVVGRSHTGRPPGLKSCAGREANRSGLFPKRSGSPIGMALRYD